MDLTSLLIGAAFGASISSVIALLILRTQIVQARADADSKIAEAQSASALAQQRFADAQNQLHAAVQEHERQRQDIRDLQAQNAQGYATLKEQQTIAARIPELEQTLRGKDARLGELTAEILKVSTALKEQETHAARIPELTESFKKCDGELKTAMRELTEFKEREATFEARIQEFERDKLELKAAFTALSVEALNKNNESFLQLAKTELEKTQTASAAELEKKQKSFEELVKPIKDGLEKYDQKIAQLDKDRMEVYGRLTGELEAVRIGSKALRDETHNLVNALRMPNTRGQWGEVQLRRVVELAGMLEHCDFHTQDSVMSDNGLLRPDMTVRMPGGKSIIVDSKVPLKAYLEGFECSDDGLRRQKFIEHAALLRKHVDGLSGKEYWSQFGGSPEFVFMFLPRESVYYAAMEHDPDLFEDAIQRRVIIATPATLIVLLRSVAFGWRQETIEKNAQEISEMGRDLYKRMKVFAEHFARVGRNLESAVKAYNDAAGSMESRVLTQARKFKEKLASDEDDLFESKLVETSVRELNSPDLKAND